MTLYNIETGAVETVKYYDKEVRSPSTRQMVTQRVETASMSVAQLKDAGYLPADVVYVLTGTELPNVTYRRDLRMEGDVAKVYYVPTRMSLAEAKKYASNILSVSFQQAVRRPRVLTPLGFYVDGSQNDLGYFEVGRRHKIPIIKDADGVVHQVSDSDYASVIEAIEINGLRLFQLKWERELAIADARSVNACIDLVYSSSGNTDQLITTW